MSDCRLCGQPVRPKGVKRLPNEYDHARGCPYATKDNVQRKRNLDLTMRRHNLNLDERSSHE